MSYDVGKGTGKGRVQGRREYRKGEGTREQKRGGY